MMTHSPGPWRYVASDFNRPTEDGSAAGSIIADFDDDQWYVATVEFAPNWEADKGLLIAAPEMFEALKAIVDCYGMGATPEKFCERVHTFMMEGKAVIAKAEGR
jgi:hypothetical protein